MRRQNGDIILILLVILSLTQFTHYYSIYSKYGFTTYHKDMSGKYKIISEREKRSIVKEIEAGARPKDISKKRQIPLSSIYSWINKYENLTKRKESKNQINAMDYVELKLSRDKLAAEVEVLQIIIEQQNMPQLRKFKLPIIALI